MVRGPVSSVTDSTRRVHEQDDSLLSATWRSLWGAILPTRPKQNPEFVNDMAAGAAPASSCRTKCPMQGYHACTDLALARPRPTTTNPAQHRGRADLAVERRELPLARFQRPLRGLGAGADASRRSLRRLGLALGGHRTGAQRHKGTPGGAGTALAEEAGDGVRGTGSLADEELGELLRRRADKIRSKKCRPQCRVRVHVPCARRPCVRTLQSANAPARGLRSITQHVHTPAPGATLSLCAASWFV